MSYFSIRSARFTFVLSAALLGAPTPAVSQSGIHAATRVNWFSLLKPSTVTAVARDFAFDFPASIPAGLTTIRLKNRGKQLHHFTVMRLDPGKTAADALAALIKAGRGPRPGWMHPVGGPEAIEPGAEANATMLLQPGNYFAFCEVPGPDPAPHFSKGMIKGFLVTPPPRTGMLPTADTRIRLTDYDFVFSRPLTSGRHVIAVTNTAAQPHMIVIIRYPPNVGNNEFLAWADNPAGKPAPGENVGGVTTIAPGATVVTERSYAPGRYGLLCFTADARDGKPHFLHGMQKEISVR